MVLYSLLSVNTAYNVNFLLHYVLAFLFTWMYARYRSQRLGERPRGVGLHVRLVSSA